MDQKIYTVGPCASQGTSSANLGAHYNKEFFPKGELRWLGGQEWETRCQAKEETLTEGVAGEAREEGRERWREREHSAKQGNQWGRGSNRDGRRGRGSENYSRQMNKQARGIGSCKGKRK